MQIHVRLLAFITTLVSAHVYADQAQVAVAANFATPMKSLATEFNKASGHTLLISSDATGKLYAQISNGAPYDVFLSADQQTASKLASEGNALAATQFTYGTGKLALWSADASTVDARGEVLKRSDLRHLAIANPKTAPYGAAAVTVLEKLGVYASWKPRLVTGENIAQTYQFVGSGNAELGFVALSQVSVDNKFTAGSGWIVDPSLHAPIRQDAILLKKGENNVAARAFLEYLHSAPARTLIQQYGYGVE